MMIVDGEPAHSESPSIDSISMLVPRANSRDCAHSASKQYDSVKKPPNAGTTVATPLSSGKNSLSPSRYVSITMPSSLISTPRTAVSLPFSTVSVVASSSTDTAFTENERAITPLNQ